MSYLLDTCVFAEYMNARPNARVVNWVDAQSDESMFISVLVLGEIQKGITKLSPSKRKKELEQFLDGLITQFDRRILALDSAVLLEWGHLTGKLEAKGRQFPIIDSLFAATAIQNHLTIVTRNLKDFSATGVPLLNLWD